MRICSRTLTIIVILIAAPVARAACPESVAVGTPDFPNEIGSFLKDDPEFAKLHLVGVNRLLPRVREDCQRGFAKNCLLADFLAKAKAGLECYAGVTSLPDDGGNQFMAYARASNTAGQLHSGSAKDMKNPSALDRTGTSAGRQGTQVSGASKYQSQNATHCVEVVPKGFKCDGYDPRYLTNICNTKISVWWKVGDDRWGLQELSPSQCYPVDNMGTDKGRTVQYKACSWDARAGYAPFGDPCRYN